MTLPARTPSSGPTAPFDVLREHVAAADDDHVLDPAAQHELAVEDVGEVTGAEPPLVEERRSGIGPLVVAGCHRGAVEQQLADMTFGQLLERLGVDDLHLETRHRLAEQRELASGEAEFVLVVDHDRLGDPLRLEHDAIDGVGDQATSAWRERATDGDLGHPERREHATCGEPES